MSEVREPVAGSLDDWLTFVTAEATRTRRAASGISGVIRRNAGRARTVLRIVRNLGFRDAVLLIARELRR